MEPETRLILTEQNREYVDHLGNLRAMETEATRYGAADLLRTISGALGPYETVPKGETKETGHSFGGHDVIVAAVELVFLLSATGITKELFETIRKWMDLKKGTLEVEIDNGGQKQRIKVQGSNPQEMYESVKAQLDRAAAAKARADRKQIL